ncbi:MAG: MmcQ/YjbR family DNA-binding protein [Devosia sp.]
MAKDGKEKAFGRIARLAKALGLAEVAIGTNYGAPALRVRGKAFLTVKAADTMVLPCPLEIKEVLMEGAPGIYYQTDHYKGWPGLLVRLDAIDDEELSLRIEDAWRFKAPRALAAQRMEKKAE